MTHSSQTEQLPEQLLDVNAICNERDRLIGLLNTAEAIISNAPIHSYGRRYDEWKRMVAAWRVERITGRSCNHPEGWRTGNICGCCLQEITT